MVWNTFLDPRRYFTPFLSLLSPEHWTISSMFFDPHYLLKMQVIGWISAIQLHFKFKNRFKQRNSFLQNLLWSFFQVRNYSTLPYHFLLESFYLKYTCVHLLNTTVIETSWAWDIGFLKFLYSIICSKNKIWKLWHELSSFNYLI